jgi:hypothetical protein
MSGQWEPYKQENDIEQESSSEDSECPEVDIDEVETDSKNDSRRDRFRRRND